MQCASTANSTHDERKALGLLTSVTSYCKRTKCAECIPRKYQTAVAVNRDNKHI